MSPSLVATYRLQFRNGMTFDRAAEIAPYLARLGISHLYASPICSAVSGSSHGYDVTDHNHLDPTLGGEAGFLRLRRAVEAHGLGLIVDIVPNHMAASLETPWWRSVVEFGAASPFARRFDIDWSRRLTLPILGDPPDDVVRAGEFSLRADAGNGCLAVGYFEHLIPVAPWTYRDVAAALGGDDAAALQELADLAQDGDAESFHDAVRSWLSSEAAAHLDDRLAAISADASFMETLLAAQPWKPMHWKQARLRLSYRRFFEVTGLVGVRVEDDEVFDDVHRLTLQLVREGLVDGLRVDHVDGLARPGAYLRRLRDAVGPGVPIFVEKILGAGERLPPDWPVNGTTGYEFIAAVADLLVEPAGRDGQDAHYRRFAGLSTGVDAELREAKQLLLRRNFAGELAALTVTATRLAAAAGQGFSAAKIEAALAEIIMGFDVYRTYGDLGPLSPADASVLAEAAGRARRAAPDCIAAIDWVEALLTGGDFEGAEVFRTRFQQLTGPVMAKSVEDTHFYRSNAMIALNEVGAHPGLAPGGTGHFLSAIEASGCGLSATATHDTKRGEDARARLLVLAECPDLWAEAVDRWSSMNRSLRADGEDAPEPAVEWLFYQALAGAWPAHLPMTAGMLDTLKARFLAYVEKASREAKLRTDWLEIDAGYEAALADFAGKILDPSNHRFLMDFAETLAPIARAGAINGVSQTLAKLTARGVPDIYQGAERLDLSLVDPDNRQGVDFATLEASLAAGRSQGNFDAALLDGRFKQQLIARGLACRRAMEPLFSRGSLTALSVEGPVAQHFTAYARQWEGRAALVVLQRLPLRRSLNGASEDGSIVLPAGLAGRRFNNLLTSETIQPAAVVPLADVLQGMPVALAVTAP